jgi:Tol biopolymer transport system component
VVIWAQGKLWRVNMQNGDAKNVAFNATVQQKLISPIRAQYRLDGNSFTARTIRDVATSPDRNTVVYHAAGYLWKKTGGGAPQRLTSNNTRFEYQPSFSPDGRSLLYTSFADDTLGSIHELDLASGSSKILSKTQGYYYGLRYSNDGKRIVYSKQGGGNLTSSTYSSEQGIYVMQRDGSGVEKIADG